MIRRVLRQGIVRLMSALTSHTRRLGLACASGLLVTLSLAGCSSDSADEDTTASPTPSESSLTAESPQAEVCADLDTARASLQALVDTDLVQEGTNTLKTRFETFKTDVQTLVDSAKAELAPQVAAVKASVATLQEVVTGLAEDPTAADVALVKPSLLAVKASAESLIDGVQQDC
jgi:hypothetical protein